MRMREFWRLFSTPRFDIELQYKRSYKDALEVLAEKRKVLDNSIMFKNIKLHQVHDRRTKVVKAQFVCDLTWIGVIWYGLRAIIYVPLG